jgi:hypothetical protein
VDETTNQRLQDRNRRIIDMVIERARRDFPDDIAIIGLTGSFRTGAYHEKSDLDLIIINTTERGWKISMQFILEDVGFDIYCTPWDTRIEEQASLASPFVSCLTDLEVLYCARPEYLERLNALRKRALDELAAPVGTSSLARAAKWIDRAKQAHADALLADAEGPVRSATGRMLRTSLYALASLNNTCFQRGVKTYREEVAAFPRLPRDFDRLYMAVIEATTITSMRSAALGMMQGVVGLHAELKREIGDHPRPTCENLRGTHEELWCNCRNKVIAGVEAGDASYAFHAAVSAQEYLDEMSEEKGTKRFDLMRHFDVRHLETFREEFLRIMDEYLEEYRKVGLVVQRYARFEKLYDHYMRQ